MLNLPKIRQECKMARSHVHVPASHATVPLKMHISRVSFQSPQELLSCIARPSVHFRLSRIAIRRKNGNCSPCVLYTTQHVLPLFTRIEIAFSFPFTIPVFFDGF